MYNESAVAGSNSTPDQMYVDKLKASVMELNQLKDTCISNEDFVQADQIRAKITVLQTQLAKMEDQSKVDILQNCVSQWQLGFVEFISEKFKTGISGNKDITSQILSAPYHITFKNIVKSGPNCFYEAYLKAFMILLPYELPDSPKSPYGWEYLSKKIQDLSSKPNEIIDLVKASLTLLVMDIFVEIIVDLPENIVSRDTTDTLGKQIIHYFHETSLRKLNAESEGKIFEKTFTLAAIVLGEIAHLSLPEFLRTISTYVEPSKRANAEETILILSASRYAFTKITNDGEFVILTQFIRDLIIGFDKNRKTGVRLAIIQTLERVIQPQFDNEEKKFYETPIWREVIPDVYKKAKKWSASDDLKEAALHLMVVILVNSSIDFYAKNIDSFFNVDLCSKGKVRPYAYSCLHQLLCGRYYHDTRANAIAIRNDTYVIGQRFLYLTRQTGEVSYGSMIGRLNSICDMMFLHRTNSKAAIPDELLDIAVDVALQIAAHSISLGVTLITQLLDTQRVESAPWSHYIGFKTLRIILDPSSGFQKFANSRADPEFERILDDVPAELEPSFAAIYSSLEQQIGVNVIGSNGYIVEQILTPLNEDIVARSEELKAAGQIQGASMLEMLNNSINDTFGQQNEEKSQVAPERGSMLTNNSARILSQNLNYNHSTLLDIYRESFRKSINVSLFETSSDGLDIGVQDANQKVLTALTEWFALLGDTKKNLSKYNISSQLYDSKRMKKKTIVKYTSEMKLSHMILIELLRLLKYVPAPEFIGGSLFVGAFLNHLRDEIVCETAFVLHFVFKHYPELRIGIINGFINFLKSTLHQDDISICTILLFMARLVKTWVGEIVPGEEVAVHHEAFYRVSCKLDAILLIYLGRPNPRIRQACIQLLYDFYSIQKTFSTHGSTRGELPLAAVLGRSEKSMIRTALFAFLEKGSRGSSLTSRLASGCKLLTFFEVASSGYSTLFQYYLGQLAVEFTLYGRPKAVRHCAKFLRLLAIPYICQTPASPDPITPEYNVTFSSLMTLLMALSGVPVSSEVEIIIGPYGQAHQLLLGGFKNLVPQVLVMDQQVNRNKLLNASYYMHPQVVNIFLQELFDSFAELRHNITFAAYDVVLDNIIHILRRICQNPQFYNLVLDDPMTNLSIIEIYVDFLNSVSTILSDVSFLSKGLIGRIKTAINFCIIVQRLSEIDVRLQQLKSDEIEMEKRSMNLETKRIVLSHLREWYEIVMEIGPSAGSELRKPAKLRYRLLEHVGKAASAIMRTGSIYADLPLPAGLLTWFTALETDGYRVFTPKLLYSYEEALGNVLANCYAGNGFESPYVFADSVFDLILPTLNDDHETFMKRNSRRMSFAEDYIAKFHLLPSGNATFNDGEVFIYPELDEEDSMQLRKHVGWLLFFALYSMMSKSKNVRYRSLVFLDELLRKFNTDSSFDVEEFLSPYYGCFYTNVENELKSKILEISNVCNQLFYDYTNSFMWEAVRCSRSVQGTDQTYTLMPSHLWITYLMTTWCDHVQFDNLSNSPEFMDLFKFIFESCLKQSTGSIECYKAVLRSPHFGEENTRVLIDTLVQLYSIKEDARRICVNLAGIAFKLHPDLTALVLSEFLSSEEFPWKAERRPPKHGSKSFIKEFLGKYNTAETTSGNSVHLENGKSAATIISQIIFLDFTKFEPYLPTVLNFVICNVETRLEDESASGNLVKSLLQGFISMLHQTKQAKDPEFDTAIRGVKKLLGWFEMQSCPISWDLDSDVNVDYTVLTQSPLDFEVKIQEFLNYIIDIFVTWKNDLVPIMMSETLNWARDGYLDPSKGMHALKLYGIFLAREQEVSEELEDALLERMYDQISVLRQVEAGIDGSETKPREPIPLGLKDLQSSAISTIIEISRIHSILISRFEKAGVLNNQVKLFWATMGLLNLPSKTFSTIIERSLQLLINFIDKGGASLVTDSFLEFITKNQGRGFGIQQLLIPHIFNTDVNINEKAILLLLSSWIVFPANAVDLNPTGIMYTLLYSITWIFGLIKKRNTARPNFLAIIQLLKDVLALVEADRFADTQRCLQTLMEIAKSKPEIPEVIGKELFDRCIINIVEPFIFTYGNNIIDYCSELVLMRNEYRKVGLEIAFVVHNFVLHRNVPAVSSLRTFANRLPFLSESTKETETFLVALVKPNDEAACRDVDLASQGRVESFPAQNLPEGSVRSTAVWFSKKLGIEASNRLFGLM